MNLLFPGEQSVRRVIFNKPGSISRARWIMRLIYAYKMFLFRYQFKLSTIEYNAIRDVGIFGTVIYIKQWYACTIP